MSTRMSLFSLLLCVLFILTPAIAQSTTSAPSSSSPSSTGAPTNGTSSSTRTGGGISPSAPADVVLNVPNLSVGRIELDVENLRADINLNAAVAGLVSINAGVQLSVQKINLTIADVKAELDLVVRLGNLVDIVERVFDSLDLNPLLISLIGNVTDIIEAVVGVVDGLLGSVTQGDTTLSFIVDNLGNIIQQVAGTGGKLVSSIVGDYLQNMTETGAVKNLGNGLTQKTFSYSPLSSLVDIIFNTAGQVVQATVQKKGGGGGGGGTTSGASTALLPSNTGAPVSSGAAGAR